MQNEHRISTWPTNPASLLIQIFNCLDEEINRMPFHSPPLPFFSGFVRALLPISFLYLNILYTGSRWKQKCLGIYSQYQDKQTKKYPICSISNDFAIGEQYIAQKY